MRWESFARSFLTTCLLERYTQNLTLSRYRTDDRILGLKTLIRLINRNYNPRLVSPNKKLFFLRPDVGCIRSELGPQYISIKKSLNISFFFFIFKWVILPELDEFDLTESAVVWSSPVSTDHILDLSCICGSICLRMCVTAMLPRRFLTAVVAVSAICAWALLL